MQSQNDPQLSNDQRRLQACLQTRYVLPAWCVQAGLAVLQGGSCIFSKGKVSHVGIGPALNPLQFTGLPLLLGQLQKEVLASAKGQTVELNVADIERASGIAGTKRQKHLNDMLASLGSLRLFSHKGLGVVGEPLFAWEEWLQDDAGLRLRLPLEDSTGELLLGVVDAYQDLVRRHRGRNSLNAFLLEKPPLIVWRSLWQGLQSSELPLWLRLEMAMQWQNCDLNLDGVYGLAWSELFDAYPKYGGGLENSSQTLASQSKILQRLGQKLAVHGFALPADDDDFLAFATQPSALQFIWKASKQKRCDQDRASFLQAVHLCFDQKAAQKESCDWMQALLVPTSLNAQGRACLTNLMQGCGSLTMILEERAKDAFWVKDGNLLLSWQNLFWEWLLRKQKGHVLPLPADLNHLEAVHLLPELDVGPAAIKEAFLRFSACLFSQGIYEQVVWGEPLASVVAPCSEGVLPSWLVQPKAVPSYESKPSYEEGKVVGSPAVKAPLLAVPENHTPLLSQPWRWGDKVAKAEQDESQALEEKQQAQGTLLKLQKLRKEAIGEYRLLCKQYFDSLDKGSRQLILDIEKRMQPEMFELHIQHRLVRFTLNRPEVWQKK